MVTQFETAKTPKEDECSSGVFNDAETSKNDSFYSFSDKQVKAETPLGSHVKSDYDGNDMIGSSDEDSPLFINETKVKSRLRPTFHKEPKVIG